MYGVDTPRPSSSASYGGGEGGRGRGGRGGGRGGGGGRGRSGYRSAPDRSQHSMPYGGAPQRLGNKRKGGGGGRDEDPDARMRDVRRRMGPSAPPATANFTLSSTPTCYLRILGYPPNTQKQVLIDFLENAGANKVNFIQVFFGATTTFVALPSVLDAQTVQLMNGILFQGIGLDIAYITQFPSLGSVEHSPILRVDPKKCLFDFITNNFDKTNRALTLDALHTKDDLRNVAVDFGDPKFCNMLFKLVAGKCSNLQTLVLSNNKISTLIAFERSAHLLSSVINISLENNSISEFIELRYLRALKKPVIDITLIGNPIRTNNVPTYAAAAANASELSPQEMLYRREVFRYLPHLKFLDTVPVDPQASQLAVAPTPLLLPRVVGSQIEPQNQQLVTDFLLKYFQLFDTDRTQLENYYGSQSCFSFSVSLTAMASSQEQLDKILHRELHDLIKAGSRNILKIAPDRQASLIRIGNTAITKLLSNEFPRTQHEVSNFIVDSVVVAAYKILQVTVRGIFTHLASNTKMSFDRIFLLTQAQNPASTIPIAIINDQLHIRPPVPFAASYATDANIQFVQQQQQQQQQLQQQQQQQQQQQLQQQQQEQQLRQQLKQQLSSVTGLNLEFAELCLNDFGWNYEVALSKFYLLKDQIPPHAFIRH